MILSFFIMTMTVATIGLVEVISSIVNLSFMVSPGDLAICSGGAFALVMLISKAVSYKLIHIEPALALQK